MEGPERIAPEWWRRTFDRAAARLFTASRTQPGDATGSIVRASRATGAGACPNGSCKACSRKTAQSALRFPLPVCANAAGMNLQTIPRASQRRPLSLMVKSRVRSRVVFVDIVDISEGGLQDSRQVRFRYYRRPGDDEGRRR